MNRAILKRRRLNDDDDNELLRTTTPEERLGMMWQLTLDAWAFKENLDAEPRLQRHFFVLKKRQR